MFFTITLPPSYEGRSHSGNFIDEFLLRIGGVPGVLTSAAVHSRPIDGAMPVSMGIRVAPRDARDVTASQATPLVGFRIVTEDYFRALGLPLLRGRSFTERDEFGPTPIGVDPDFPWRVIISERLAEMLFADDDPTGRQVSLWVGEMDTPAVLIGVVGNVRERGLDSDPTLAVYLPFKGADYACSLDILVHASGDPLALVGTLRSILAELDPSVPLSNVETVDMIVADSVAGRRFTMVLLASLAGLALALALIGIYGVQAYSVARRTSELGIRLALGATGGSIIRLIASQAMVPALVGLVIGWIGSLALSRFLSSLVFGIATTTDAVAFVAAGSAVIGTALIACYVPARRGDRGRSGGDVASGLGRRESHRNRGLEGAPLHDLTAEPSRAGHVHHPDVADVLLPGEVDVLAVRGERLRAQAPALAAEVGDRAFLSARNGYLPDIPRPLGEAGEVNPFTVECGRGIPGLG